MFTAFIDGYCQGRQISTAAIVQVNGRELTAFGKYILVPEHQTVTLKTAIYSALWETLLFFKRGGFAEEKILIRMDAVGIAEQLKGNKAIGLDKNSSYAGVAQICMRLIREAFPQLEVQWIKTDLNQQADRLAKKIMKTKETIHPKPPIANEY